MIILSTPVLQNDIGKLPVELKRFDAIVFSPLIVSSDNDKIPCMRNTYFGMTHLETDKFLNKYKQQTNTI